MRLEGRRLLVAEDEAGWRELVRDALEAEGCVVVEAGNGRVALETLSSLSFDLVVSDVEMPGMSGIEVYRRACLANPLLRRRFLFVTGDWLGEATAVFLRESGCPYLEKPCALERLLASVREILEEQDPVLV